jgi:alkanesulfonate monooxygenase SsuD/methylene tetrahydromethanopterin reductase-like flavin-dependent oxidoreductase (luciferase family)
MHLEHALSCAVIGAPATVKAGLEAFAQRTGADELMVTASIFNHSARLRSFEIAARAMGVSALAA